MQFKHLSSLLLAGLLGCSDSNDNFTPVPPPEPEPQVTLSAEITRTEYGIPHIKADDWASLGYGYGYAYAQDNFCIAMREIVFATSRSAELLGETEGDVVSDFVLRSILGTKQEFRERLLGDTESEAYQLGSGFAAGMNRYLAETGVENLPVGSAGCRDADWVYAIDETDLWMMIGRIGLGGSSDQGLIRQGIYDASGDSSGPAASAAPDAEQLKPGFRRLGAQLTDERGGSNALAVGRDLSQTGSGILLGNPHQPWNGAGRWYEVHLTIPGEYDVAGAALQGLPWVGIGFNNAVAWTHTVSFATRFTLFDLDLDPNDRFQYFFDGEAREITSKEVSIEVRLADDSLETRSRTFYNSHFGPIINLKAVSPLLDGWPMFSGNVLSLRDANLLTDTRAVDQYLAMGKAQSMAEFTEALKSIGIPVFHTLAADRFGEAFYGEVAVIPHVTQQQLDSCMTGSVPALVTSLSNNAIIALDGDRSACNWGEDPDTPAGTNIYGYEARPKIQTRDYVGNSNNSYWLSDANNPLTGFPVVFGWLGHEDQQQFLRTRIGHLMVEERRQATDGFDAAAGFTLDSIKQLMYRNRVYGAEINLADIQSICAGPPPAGTNTEVMDRARSACAVLASWDQEVDTDSAGAQVFTEFWRNTRSVLGNDFSNVVESDEFWLVDFDPADPLNTPSGIDTSIENNQLLVVESLSDAVQSLQAAGVVLDAPWSATQFYPRNNQDIPIHGGDPNMGVYGAISVSLDAGGYFDIRAGNSYIQAVTWDEGDCPIADAILVHSQSSDPDSDHYGDQTALYSNKEWVRYPYCEDAIETERIADTLLLEE
ncbi:MAG: penicillin acylase family protein [Halieaceae bacterium]